MKEHEGGGGLAGSASHREKLGFPSMGNRKPAAWTGL